MQTKSKNNIILAIVVVLILVVGVFLILQRPHNTDIGSLQDNNNVCTMEAKLCPNGSYVGRTGPGCEFAACPTTTTDTTNVTTGWKTFSDQAQGITFKYPETVSTPYIHSTDWPPKVEVKSGPFTCTEAGAETATAGKTTKQTINGHEYCVTKESEGAAGTTYTQYAYATQIQNKVGYFTFSLGFVQCANYDNPQKSACETERVGFSIDPVIDQIAQTVTLK